MITLIHRDNDGKPTGRKIFLDEKCNDIGKLECQLILLGQNGLAYSDIWNKIAEKKNRLESKQKPKKKKNDKLNWSDYCATNYNRNQCSEKNCTLFKRCIIKKVKKG